MHVNFVFVFHYSSIPFQIRFRNCVKSYQILLTEFLVCDSWDEKMKTLILTLKLDKTEKDNGKPEIVHMPWCLEIAFFSHSLYQWYLQMEHKWMISVSQWILMAFMHDERQLNYGLAKQNRDDNVKQPPGKHLQLIFEQFSWITAKTFS